MTVLPFLIVIFFLWSRKIRNFQGQDIKAKLIKQCLCIFLFMTFNKLNNVHISVVCSDNACLGLIKKYHEQVEFNY